MASIEPFGSNDNAVIESTLSIFRETIKKYFFIYYDTKFDWVNYYFDDIVMVDIKFGKLIHLITKFIDVDFLNNELITADYILSLIDMDVPPIEKKGTILEEIKAIKQRKVGLQKINLDNLDLSLSAYMQKHNNILPRERDLIFKFLFVYCYDNFSTILSRFIKYLFSVAELYEIDRNIKGYNENNTDTLDKIPEEQIDQLFTIMNSTKSRMRIIKEFMEILNANTIIEDLQGYVNSVIMSFGSTI